MGLTEIIREYSHGLNFRMREIGAFTNAIASDEYRSLLKTFPGSRMIAIEVDAELCEQLNSKAPLGVEYVPVALGRREESRPFYQTAGPMCSSLYKPNKDLNDRYVDLGDLTTVMNVAEIETVSLDYFTKNQGIDTVDFIQIDIQGAELEVFGGGEKTLSDVVAIVTEVGFVDIYEGQPLFGDICSCLYDSGFQFNRFLKVCGHTLKPCTKQNIGQHMYADALFLRDLTRLDELKSEQLLKMAILSELYGNFDVIPYCLQEHDRKEGSRLLDTLRLQQERK